MKKRDAGDGTENRGGGLRRREFFAAAGRIGMAAVAAKFAGLDRLASAVADRAVGTGPRPMGTTCGEGSDYTCDGDRVDCDTNFSCEGQMFGCTRRMFVCRSIFTCSGPGGGHNCTWRVKFFCEDTHSCSPPSHYHNCSWPHSEPSDPAEPKEPPISGK